MARLVEWHEDHARDAERARFRSAVRRRFRLRVWLRRIPRRCQRPVLLRPAKEKILVAAVDTVIASSRGIESRPMLLRRLFAQLGARLSTKKAGVLIPRDPRCLPNFPRNQRPHHTEYSGERPEMTTQRRGAKE